MYEEQRDGRCQVGVSDVAWGPRRRQLVPSRRRVMVVLNGRGSLSLESRIRIREITFPYLTHLTGRLGLEREGKGREGKGGSDYLAK